MSLLVAALRDTLIGRAPKSVYTISSLVSELAAGTNVVVAREDVEAALRELANEDAPIVALQRGGNVVITGNY